MTRGVHVPHSFWLFSLHSEVCPVIDSFIRWDVISGVVSILQAPKQLTLVLVLIEYFTFDWVEIELNDWEVDKTELDSFFHQKDCLQVFYF